MPWPGILIHRCRDSGQSFKYYSAHRSIKLAGLLKHGTFVAGNHDLTLTLYPIAVVLNPSLFNFETGRSNTVHTCFVGFGSSSLLVGGRNVFLEIIPACVFTHMGTSC